jgi:iron complex outermembrane receptor protein
MDLQGSLTEQEIMYGVFSWSFCSLEIKQESFIKNISAISTLKLRAGWGKTGQQELPALDGNKLITILA